MRSKGEPVLFIATNCIQSIYISYHGNNSERATWTIPYKRKLSKYQWQEEKKEETIQIQEKLNKDHYVAKAAKKHFCWFLSFK